MGLRNFATTITHAIRRPLAALPIAADRRCPVCERRVRHFLPYRLASAGLPDVLHEADVVGSDMLNFECPACGCHDRERHLLLYLRASGLDRRLRGAHVLHFAPERHLRQLIRAQLPAAYVMADLFPSTPDIRRMDMTAMDAAAENFDVVIANHVLEHVADDGRALDEIRRVLRPGGFAILQTPFAAGRSAKHEDPAIVDPRDRLAAYGQEDHVRLYGADFVAFVASHGFVDLTATHAQLLPDVDAGTVGVNPREPLLLFARPQP